MRKMPSTPSRSTINGISIRGDRLPAAAGGNVHNYNIYVDDVAGLAAQRPGMPGSPRCRRPTRSCSTDRRPKTRYKFKPFLNGSIATEDGAVLVEKSVYVDCATPLRNNQTDPNDPTYTEKIPALDTIYHFDNADTTTIDYRGSSTNAPGNTLPGPVQAAVKPFSWNGFSSLPYAYVMDDPACPAILSDPNYGAGAGVLVGPKPTGSRRRIRKSAAAAKIYFRATKSVLPARWCIFHNDVSPSPLSARLLVRESPRTHHSA